MQEALPSSSTHGVLAKLHNGHQNGTHLKSPHSNGRNYSADENLTNGKFAMPSDDPQSLAIWQHMMDAMAEGDKASIQIAGIVETSRKMVAEQTVDKAYLENLRNDVPELRVPTVPEPSAEDHAKFDQYVDFAAAANVAAASTGG